MNPALLKLIYLQGRGMLRRMTRGAGTARRIVFFVVGAMLFIMWLLSGVANSFMRRSDPARVRAVTPLAILGVCILTAITSAGDKAIAFTPGEVDQLFPGPFSRRELLAYKILKSLFAAMLTGLILSIALLRHAQWWVACFVGVFLSLLFVQFFSIAVVLAGQTIGMAAYSRVRKAVVILVIAGGVIFARLWIGNGSGGAAAESALMAARSSSVGQIIFAPFEPFGNAITASSAGSLAVASFYALILIAAMVALVVLLDANYLEAAMVASQRRYEKIQRIRSGSFLSGVGVGKSTRWRLPMLPWTGGAGPIAWRQLTSALRSSRGLLLLMLIIAISAAPILLSGSREHRERMVAPAIGIAIWLTFFASSMLNFDFRGDLDQIDVLKALPIGSVAISLGQLIAPTLVMASLHIAVLVAIGLAIPQRWPIWVAAAVIAVPFNLLLFCTENLVFLLFPSRPAAASPGDLQILGRKFIFLLIKAAILMVCCAVAFGFAILVWVLSGKSIPAATITLLLLILLECAALVPFIAWAFRRFDPATDTPA